MVNGDLIISAIVVVSTAIGSYATGKRSASRDAIGIANDTVDMLQAQIESLKDDKESRDAELIDLRARVGLLENLVTQKADVAAVHTEVKLTRAVVEKIAVKVGV